MVVGSRSRCQLAVNPLALTADVPRAAQRGDAQKQLGLGYAFEQQGKLDEANQAFEAAKQLDPELDAPPR